MFRFGIFLILIHICQSSEILSIYPSENFSVFSVQNVTMNINTTSIITNDEFIWSVNINHSYHHLITLNDIQYQTHHSYTIHINSDIWDNYNYLVIGCIIEYNNYYEECPNYIILVQRKVDAPTYLSRIGEFFEWGAPFTLDVFDYSPEILYAYVNIDATTGRYICCDTTSDQL